MILSDVDIKNVLKRKKLIIDPLPEEKQIDSTAVDLRIGKPLFIWNPKLVKQKGVDVRIDIDNFDFIDLASNFMHEVNKENNGKYIIKPGIFYLAPTFEKIGFPTDSKLAARVEGKSSLARLGLVIHMTAPTIHCGYGPGIITLEIYNYGPFPIMVTPGKSFICQLIIECVKTKPKERVNRKFTGQKTPKGNTF